MYFYLCNSNLQLSYFFQMINCMCHSVYHYVLYLKYSVYSRMYILISIHHFFSIFETNDILSLSLVAIFIFVLNKVCSILIFISLFLFVKKMYHRINYLLIFHTIYHDNYIFILIIFFINIYQKRLVFSSQIIVLHKHIHIHL